MEKKKDLEAKMKSIEFEAKLRLAFFESVEPNELTISVRNLYGSEIVVDYIVQSQNSYGRINFSELRNETEELDIKKAAEDEIRKGLNSMLGNLCFEQDKKQAFQMYKTSEDEVKKKLAVKYNLENKQKPVVFPSDIIITEVDTRTGCYRKHRDMIAYHIEGREEHGEMRTPLNSLGLKRRKN